MAGRRRTYQRIEPGFGRASRPAPRKAASAGGARPRPPQRSAGRGRRGPARRGVFAAVGGLLRGIVYWSVVAGIIAVAGVVAVVGYYGSKLPPTAEWTLPERPASVRIVAADGRPITNRGDAAGRSLTLDQMPSYLPEAVIAIEDRRFYWHFGLDPIGLARAFLANIRAGAVVEGGSTLTQQLAKNLFLEPERTLERKVQELILAVWLEASLSKRQILELYLNRVYLGAGAYGVDAAAHRYFGKSASAVTLAEAATLAALLKAPSRYSPVVDPAAAEARAQLVIAAMHEAGFIDGREASLALSEEVRPVRDVAGGSGRYVADWVTAQLPSFVGALEQDVVVDTTIDLALQAAAARAVSGVLAEEGATYGAGQGAFVAMDPDGAVRALVGGRDYDAGPFNRAVDARRQPGSAFKPFVYLAALERGLIPESVRIDQPVSINGWSPENYSHTYLGPVTLQSALALSLNTVSAQLASEVGPAAVVEAAHRLGIASPLQATPSIALGTSEVSLLEMTGAFAVFANGGRGVIPHVIRRITAEDGTVLYRRSGSGPGQVVDPPVVGMMNAMLRDALERGTGKRAAIAGWPAAGKTGTTQDFRDAWFIGYTGALVAGAWFGNDDARPTRKASGSNLPAVAWQRFMSEALAGRPVAELPGDYRFRDPANVAGGRLPPPLPDTLFAEDGVALRLDPQPVQAGPVPPAGVGQAMPRGERPERRGFFRRLFGG